MRRNVAAVVAAPLHELGRTLALMGRVARAPAPPTPIDPVFLERTAATR